MKYVVTLELETEEGTTEADIRTALHLHGVTGEGSATDLAARELADFSEADLIAAAYGRAVTAAADCGLRRGT